MGFESNKNEMLARKRLATLRTLKTVGEYGEGQVKLLTPVQLGALRDSYTHQVEEARKAVIWGTNQEYAPYVEKGTGRYAEDGDGRDTPWTYQDPETGQFITTVGQQPQPHLRPGIENNKPTIKAIIKNNMKV